MKSEAMVQHLWSLANLIVGFSVVRSLATAYEFDKALSALRTAPVRAQAFFVFVRFLFASLAATAVWYLSVLATPLDPTHANIWEATTVGRIICIYLFAALSVLALIAPKLTTRDRPPVAVQPSVPADGLADPKGRQGRG